MHMQPYWFTLPFHFMRKKLRKIFSKGCSNSKDSSKVRSHRKRFLAANVVGERACSQSRDGLGDVGTTIGSVFLTSMNAFKCVADFESTVVATARKPLRLPNELMEIIFQYLGPCELARIRETCTTYYGMVSNILYREIHLTCEESRHYGHRSSVHLGNLNYRSIRSFLDPIRTRASNVRRIMRILRYVKTLKITYLSMDDCKIPEPQDLFEDIDTNDLLNWMVYILAPAILPNVATLDIVFTASVHDNHSPMLKNVLDALDMKYPNATKAFTLDISVDSNVRVPDYSNLNRFQNIAFELADTNLALIEQVFGPQLPETLTGLMITSHISATAVGLRKLLLNTNLNGLSLLFSHEIAFSPSLSNDSPILPPSLKNLEIKESHLVPPRQSTIRTKIPAEHVENLYIMSNAGYVVRQFKFANVKDLEYRPAHKVGSLLPEFLPTFKSVMYHIKSSLTRLKLSIDIDLLNSLAHSFTPYPPNLRIACFSTTGSFNESNSNGTPLCSEGRSIIMVLVKIMSYCKMSGFLSYFLNYSPVFINTMEPLQQVDPYCLQFLAIRQNNWYQVDSDRFNDTDRYYLE